MLMATDDAEVRKVFGNQILRLFVIGQKRVAGRLQQPLSPAARCHFLMPRRQDEMEMQGFFVAVDPGVDADFGETLCQECDPAFLEGFDPLRSPLIRAGASEPILVHGQDSFPQGTDPREFPRIDRTARFRGPGLGGSLPGASGRDLLGEVHDGGIRDLRTQPIRPVLGPQHNLVQT